MKNTKIIVSLISAFVFAAAAVAAVVLFKDQIKNFFCETAAKLNSGKKNFTSEEFEDFADI